jgi:endonuclease VIII
VPEGDTIYRSATTLRRWLAGREITAARSVLRDVKAEALIGRTVEAVEPRGKHLLIRFSGDAVLHTHMRMTGSWHVYRFGERWRKPDWQARIVLEAGDRVAVCFNAPVIELMQGRAEDLHPSLSELGPDVLVEPLDLEEVRRRAGTRPPTMAIGELLLDQRVVSGIGNIWRCEAMFVRKLDPYKPLSEISQDELDAVVSAAAEMMRASAGGGRRSPYVYGRTGRPCHRCRSRIQAELMGDQPRRLYWCPTCQA